MSLIYPTNNSPNESPGRARNALGRSACTLVVAGALVLPLTPAGAVTDPGVSTPASTATVTPQVVADQEPQATPQLVVETPDEVNPYYGEDTQNQRNRFLRCGGRSAGQPQSHPLRRAS